jgi:hypothetical protein
MVTECRDLHENEPACASRFPGFRQRDLPLVELLRRELRVPKGTELSSENVLRDGVYCVVPCSFYIHRSCGTSLRSGRLGLASISRSASSAARSAVLSPCCPPSLASITKSVGFAAPGFCCVGVSSIFCDCSRFVGELDICDSFLTLLRFEKS